MPDIDKILNNMKAEGYEVHTPQLSINDGYKTANISRDKDLFKDIIDNNRNKAATFNQSMIEQYEKADIDRNSPLVLNHSLDELAIIENNKKAKEQWRLTQAKNSLAQIIENEVVLGTLEGFSNLFDFMYQKASEGLYKATDGKVGEAWDMNNYSNVVSRFFEDVIKKNKERLAIYRENPNKAFDVGDFAWWADNFVTVGSTASLLIPSTIIGRGVGKLGKLMKLESRLGTHFANVNKIHQFLFNTSDKLFKRPNLLARNITNFGDQATMAIVSRIGENYQEAREAYNTSYDSTVEKLRNMDAEQWKKFIENNPEYADVSWTPERIAQNIVSKAAKDVFDRDMKLFYLDLLQYRSIQQGIKAARLTSGGLRMAQKEALSELAGKEAKSITEQVSLLNKIKSFPGTAAAQAKEFGKFAIKHPIKALGYSEVSEAFEEGYQGVNSQRAQDLVEAYFNPKISTKSFMEYAQDPHILEQAVWGMIGGLSFGAMNKGVNYLLNYSIGKYKLLKHKDNFDETSFRELLESDDHVGQEEIRGRKATMDEYINKSKEIEGGRNPFVQDENGTNQEFANDIEKEKAKRDAKKEFIQNLVFDATDAGNIDLLIDFISDPTFTKYLRDNGVEFDEADSKFLNDTIKDFADTYIETKQAIYANTDVDNDQVATMMARSIANAKNKIDSLNGQINDIQNELATLEESNDWTNTHQNLLEALYVKKRIEQHKANIQTYERDSNLSKQAKEAAIKREYDSINVLYDLLRKHSTGSLIDEELKQGNENVDRVISTYTNDLKTNNYKSLDDIDKRVISLAGREVAYEIAKSNWEAAIPEPNNKNSYNELYEDMAASTFEFMKTRLGRSLNNVQQWLRKQTNIDEAVNKIYNNEVKELQDDLDILKLGAKNRRNITSLFNVIKNGIQKEKENADKQQTEATIDGSNVSEKEAKDINNDLNNNNPVEEAEEKDDKTKPPVKKGKDEKKTKSFEEEAIDSATVFTDENDIGPDDGVIQGFTALDLAAKEEPIDEIERERLNEEKEYFATILMNPEGSVFDAGRKAGIVAILGNEYRTKLIKSKGSDYLNTDDYKALKEEVINYMADNDVIPEHIGRKHIDRCLQIAFSDIVDTLKRNEDNTTGVIDLLKALQKISLSANYDEQASKLYAKTQEEIDKEMNDFFRLYFSQANVFKGETSDGKVIIDLDALFEYIKEQADINNWNYDTIALAIRNIINYVYSNTSSIYQFEGKDYIDNLDENGKPSDNLSNVFDLINQIYKKEFVTEEKEDSFHVQVSNMNFGKILGENGYYIIDEFGNPVYAEGYEPNNNASKTNLLKKAESQPLFTKVVKILNTEDNREEDYSLAVGFKDEQGRFIEVGYLALIEANETNTVLKKLNSTEGLNLAVRKVNDNEFVFENYAFDELMNELIKAYNNNYNGDLKDIANTLYKYFHKSNASIFNRQKGDRLIELKGRTISIKEQNAFLQHPLIKAFILESNFKYKGNKVDKSILDDLDSFVDKNSDFIKIMFNKVASSISDILFYPYKNSLFFKGKINISANVLLSSYKDYAAKVWKNYEQTHMLRMDGGSIELEYKSDNASRFNYDKGTTRDIKDIGLKSNAKKYKFVYFDGNAGYVEGQEETIVKPDCFTPGTCGILMGDKNGLPFVATFKDSNPLDTESKLYSGIKDYLKELIDNYYNATGSGISQSYDKLKETITNLCVGPNALLTGVILKEGFAGFSIGTYDVNGDFKKIAEFYKYNLKYNPQVKAWLDARGTVVPNAELENYRGKNARIFDSKGNNSLVLGKDKENDTKNIELFISNFLGSLSFSKTGISTRKGVNRRNTNSLVSFDNDGKMTLHLGTKKDGTERTITYNNYVDFAVSNNAFTTTYSGRGVRGVFTTKGGATKSSMYLGFKTQKVSEEAPDTRLTKGLLLNLKESNVQEGDIISSEDVLLYGGENINNLVELESNGLIGENGFIPEKVKISYKPNPREGHKDDHASYNPETGEITIWGPGIQFVSNPNTDRQFHILRLLVHENVHRVFDNSNFFKEGKVSETRVNRILDIYDRFKVYINESGDQSWIKFINDFDSGNNVDNAKTFAERANVANEFVAEALSNKYLMGILNEIEYKTENTIKDIKTENKTLLQKLFDIIIKAFNSIRNKDEEDKFEIKDDTALSALYDSLGTPTEINTFNDENSKTVEEKETETPEDNNESIGDVNMPYSIDEEVYTGSKDFDYEGDEELTDETFDDGYNEFSSKIISTNKGLTPSEHKLDFYDRHRDFNPFRIKLVTDMENYIHSFPLSEQAAIRAELDAGATEYLCR